MAKGTIYVRSDMGIRVAWQPVRSTYVTPTEVLCVERGKGDGTPQPETQTQDFQYAADGEKITIAEPVLGSTASFSLQLALPNKANLGGITALFKACKLNQTDATDSITYTPDLSSTAVCSLEFVEKRRITKFRDCTGQMTINSNPGEITYVTFDMTGVLEGVDEVAPADNDNSIPRNILNPETDFIWGAKKGGIEVGGKDLVATTYSLTNSIETSNQATYDGDITDSLSISPTFSVSFRETEQNEAAFSDFKDGTPLTLSVSLFGKNGSDQGSITAAKGVVSTPDSRGETNGYRTADRVLSLRKTSGNDNFSLVIK